MHFKKPLLCTSLNIRRPCVNQVSLQTPCLFCKEDGSSGVSPRSAVKKALLSICFVPPVGWLFTQYRSSHTTVFGQWRKINSSLQAHNGQRTVSAGGNVFISGRFPLRKHVTQPRRRPPPCRPMYHGDQLCGS